MDLILVHREGTCSKVLILLRGREKGFLYKDNEAVKRKTGWTNYLKITAVNVRRNTMEKAQPSAFI